jgi:hypothetical protein
MTLATAVVAAAIVYVVTGNRDAWLGVVAGPIVLLGAYLVLSLMNLGGWNRRWKAAWAPIPEGGRLTLRLWPKDRTVRYQAPDLDCWVRSPSGTVAKHRPGGRTLRGQYYAVYPEQFEPAEPVTRGRYRVTWVEETGPQSGQWREILTHRLTVTDAMLRKPGP